MLDGYFRELDRLGSSDLFFPDSLLHFCLFIPLVLVSVWHFFLFAWLVVWCGQINEQWTLHGVACFFPYSVREFGFCMQAPKAYRGNRIITILNPDGSRYISPINCSGDLCP
jgi:hypothetical protein